MENNAGNIVMTLTAGNFKLAVLTLIPALSLHRCTTHHHSYHLLVIVGDIFTDLIFNFGQK